MPEEINRRLTDQLSTFLFCPTGTAVANLKREGNEDGGFLVGDIITDALNFYRGMTAQRSAILSDLELDEGGYCVLTMHRPQNADDPVRL